ncbi:MAG TPA: ABC transporter substrate-binding protein [Pyrinomonadaceae bacterium]|jgi:ABC-type Fe3+-hydroxamate transport system, periplasmic component|nr:ABC transporter substrate-binding protein [Pyrinomonadaceae bacterium]
MPRIVSFLPSATEIACALGLEDSLIGITHECDYPPHIKTKPVVVRNVLPIESMTQSQIDYAVADRMRQGLSLYQIDEELLRKLAPDLILTQNLCQVCAPSGNEVSQVLNALNPKPSVLWLTPRSIDEIFDNIRDLGAATSTEEAAATLINDCQDRLNALKEKVAQVSYRPRVFCMEWLDPVYASGHWVPELVKIAGGIDEIASEQGESVRVSWKQICDWDPEVLVIIPCGFNLPQIMKQIWSDFKNPEMDLRKLSAFQNQRIFAVDANSFFARPGPRVVEGAEILAHLIHPELFQDSPLSKNHEGIFKQVDMGLLQGEMNTPDDYYWENGFMVFTGSYLTRRGYCCDSGCRHCPY